MNQPSNKLLIQILVGIALGTLIGGFLPPVGNSIVFIGELFIRALLMLVVPLVITSMVVGVSSLGDVRQMGSLGGKTILYYLTTTAIAVIIGLVLVNVVQPGYAETEAQRIALRGGEQLDVPYRVDGKTVTLESGSFGRTYDDRYMVFLVDRNSGVRGTIESSPRDSNNRLRIEAWTDANGMPVIPPPSGTGVRVDLGIAERMKGKDRSIPEVLQEVALGLIPRNLFASMANNEVLPLIVISLIFGGVLTTLGKQGRLLIRTFDALNEAIMVMVNLLMRAAPIGIGALIAGRLGMAGGFAGFLPELIRVSKYTGTVIVALALHSCIVLPIVLYFFGKQLVKPYAAGMAPALTTAFSTASSSATLPVTLECVTEKNFISERTASFVLPLGATINMDGTALYEAVAAVFIAQIYGIELSFVQMTIVFLTSTLAAVGAAGIPEAGLVTMAIVLRAVDLPIEGISLILIVDWFLDRCRTTVNVWGDAIGAAVVDWMVTKEK